MVLLISGILAAVAIPTFFGAHRHAADSAAMGHLDAAAGVLGEIWAQDRSFPSASTLATDMSSLASSLPVQAAGNTSGITPPAPVTVAESAGFVVVGAEGGGLACLYVAYSETASSPGPGTWYGKTGYSPSQGSCPVSASYTPASGWQRSWGAMGL